MKKILLLITYIFTSISIFSQNINSIKTLHSSDWSISTRFYEDSKHITLTAHPKFQPIYNGLSPKKKLRRQRQNGKRYGEYISFNNGEIQYSNQIPCGNDMRQLKAIRSFKLINNNVVINYVYRKENSIEQITEKEVFEIIEWSAYRIILKSLSQSTKY